MSKLTKKIAIWQSKPGKRREDGVFVAEGLKLFSELPIERVQAVVASKEFADSHKSDMANVLAGLSKEASVEYLPEDAFRKLSDTKTPQGILAVVSMYDYSQEEMMKKENGMYMLLENLQDPGNLGTILRSGEAAGIDGVLMTGDCVDVYNPKVIRASMGAVFRVPFAMVEDPYAMLSEFHQKGGVSYAAHLHSSEDYILKDYRKPTIFMIGNESKGLSEKMTAASKEKIIIPMKGQVESLNAAMAATVLMFEAARQRRL